VSQRGSGPWEAERRAVASPAPPAPGGNQSSTASASEAGFLDACAAGVGETRHDGCRETNQPRPGLRAAFWADGAGFNPARHYRSIQAEAIHLPSAASGHPPGMLSVISPPTWVPVRGVQNPSALSSASPHRCPPLRLQAFDGREQAWASLERDGEVWVLPTWANTKNPSNIDSVRGAERAPRPVSAGKRRSAGLGERATGSTGATGPRPSTWMLGGRDRMVPPCSRRAWALSRRGGCDAGADPSRPITGPRRSRAGRIFFLPPTGSMTGR